MDADEVEAIANAQVDAKDISRKTGSGQGGMTLRDRWLGGRSSSRTQPASPWTSREPTSRRSVVSPKPEEYRSQVCFERP